MHNWVSVMHDLIPFVMNQLAKEADDVKAVCLADAIMRLGSLVCHAIANDIL